MTGYKKCMIGGIGGLLPLLLSLAFAEGSVLAAQLVSDNGGADWVWILGMGMKALALFALGGVWAYCHASEEDPKKLLQLGVMAPALVMTFMNASNLEEVRANLGKYTGDPQASVSGLFDVFPRAYAQEAALPNSPSSVVAPKGVIVGEAGGAGVEIEHVEDPSKTAEVPAPEGTDTIVAPTPHLQAAAEPGAPASSVEKKGILIGEDSALGKAPADTSKISEGPAPSLPDAVVAQPTTMGPPGSNQEVKQPASVMDRLLGGFLGRLPADH